MAGERGRVVAATAAELAVAAAGWIAAAIDDAVAERGRCALALTGGTAIRPVYAELAAAADVPWPSVDAYFGDERCVPPEDAESNYRQAHELLLSRVPVAPERTFRMLGELEDREAAARAYQAVLAAPLDVLLLGVGEDGHTASLFPRSPQLRERSRRVVPARGPTPPRDRLTITPPVIASARRVVVVVSGEEKAEAVARALTGPYDPGATPAQLARDGAWFLDEAAAALLGRAGA
jgi:6-phosphogluconolactonase